MREAMLGLREAYKEGSRRVWKGFGVWKIFGECGGLYWLSELRRSVSPARSRQDNLGP
jgi:hypothetical protein